MKNREIKTVGIVWSFLKSRGHHLVFAVSILVMGHLLYNWSDIFSQYIDFTRDQRHTILELKMKVLALTAGANQEVRPTEGIQSAYGLFEIVHSQTKIEGAMALLPHWPDYYIRSTTTIKEAIDRNFRRQRLMLIGEGSLLFFLLFLGLVLMYKYVRLEKKSTREITEFWSRITHEIKTPITGIKSFLQSLKNPSLDGGEIKPLVNLALQQIQRQEKLAENILAGSRLKDHSNSINVSPVNVKEFVTNYFQQVLHLTNTDVTLEFELKEVQHMMADDPSLKVIMDNITENAVKYGPENLHLTLHTYSEGNQIIMDFSDNGPGFHPSFQKNIFSAFKVLEDRPTDIPHGTGMGLYISRELAQEMGGDLTTLSSPNKIGARLRLILPGVKTS